MSCIIRKKQLLVILWRNEPNSSQHIDLQSETEKMGKFQAEWGVGLNLYSFTADSARQLTE
jgi:hypothetical protein